MCLILFAVNPNERYRLVVAANRDELYERPTQPAGFWTDNTRLLAGRDIQAGGTWLGVNRRGDFAAVTNFAETPPDPLPPRSRGDLPVQFLSPGEGSIHPTPLAFVNRVAEEGHLYRGFNLITANPGGCFYYGNRSSGPRQIGNGVHGLSNQLINCDWPKVIEGKNRLSRLVSGTGELTEALFSLLADAGDQREYSNSFIASDIYGTRASTVVLIDQAGTVYFEERAFGKQGEPGGRQVYEFSVDAG